MNYIKDVSIDIDHLDRCFIEQPVLAMQCQDVLSKKIREKDDLKLEIEVLEAEIDRDIRAKSTKKPTEAEIKNLIILDPIRIEKIKEYNLLNEKINILRGAVNSFEHRKASLKSLTDLYFNGYFSAVEQDKKFNDDKETHVKNKIRSSLKKDRK